MRDLVVIGAGPAGMAAAARAADLGLGVTLLDEQPRAGGQIYRDVDRVAGLRGDLLGKDYAAGLALTAALRHDAIQHIHGAVVWAIEDGFRVSFTRDGRGAQIAAKRLVLATGALERPMPLPGWTLPGVMTAGAGQILLKQSGVLARSAVLVGSGPLLYLLAAQMVRAGRPPVALVETQTRGDMLRAARHFGGALRGWRYLLKGLGMLAAITRAGVPRHTGATDIAIEGDTRAEALCFTRGGRRHRIGCETVFLHHGVVPNTQAARSLGVSHAWDAGQSCFVPSVDAWGESDVPGVFIAGDGAGIGGAKAAEATGRLAALKAAQDLGRLSASRRDQQAGALRTALAKDLAARPFLDRAYPPYAQAVSPADATVICRCEEVTAGDIRGYARLGCLGPNQAKAFGRAGMGPCQGRYCGLTVTALLAEANRRTPDETGYYRIRPPLKPVTLGELAAMEQTPPRAAEQEMEMIERIDVGQRMSRIVKHNGVAYLCGQVGEGAGVAEQTRACLSRIEALLAKAGSSPEQILQAVIWLADMEDFPQMNEVWDAWVPEGHAPARACGQARLARPDLKVEIIVTAACRDVS